MLPAHHIAFKEWAVVCAALAEGRQTLILRKGGIHEGDRGFQVEHQEFWLFPTYEHEQADDLTDEARPLLQQVERQKPAMDIVRIAHYAVVDDVIEIRDPIVLPSLVGLHIWSDRTIDTRFHYKRPGLSLIIVRMYTAAAPMELPNSPHFAGCRSWVELPNELPTSGLTAVLNDTEFARRCAEIQVAASPIRLA
jgi:hypothetical protein